MSEHDQNDEEILIITKDDLEEPLPPVMGQAPKPPQQFSPWLKIGKYQFPKVLGREDFLLTAWAAIIICLVILFLALFVGATFCLVLNPDAPASTRGEYFVFFIALLGGLAACVWFLVWQYKTRNRLR